MGLHADEALFDTRDDIVAREDVWVPLAPWGRGRADHTAAFARQVVLGAPGRDVAPDTLFAESVVDRGINVVDAGVESGVENGFCLRLGDLTAARDSPQLHRAVSQHRDLKPRPPEFPFRETSHIHPLCFEPGIVSYFSSPVLRPSALNGNFLSFDYADRKSKRLNSSHLVISYAVFCLKKKKRDKDPGFIIIYLLLSELVREYLLC